jgi:hypothetical protein
VVACRRLVDVHLGVHAGGCWGYGDDTLVFAQLTLRIPISELELSRDSGKEGGTPRAHRLGILAEQSLRRKTCASPTGLLRQRPPVLRWWLLEVVAGAGLLWDEAVFI